MKKLNIEEIWSKLGATSDDQKMLVSALVHSIYFEPSNHTGAREMDLDEYKKAVFGKFAESRPIDVDVYSLAVSWANDFEIIARQYLPEINEPIFDILFPLLEGTCITENVIFKLRP